MITIQFSKTEYGYLVDILGEKSDFGMYHDEISDAWQHFLYVLRKT
jgi:hypothetical protein